MLKRPHPCPSMLPQVEQCLPPQPAAPGQQQQLHGCARAAPRGVWRLVCGPTRWGCFCEWGGGGSCCEGDAGRCTGGGVRSGCRSDVAGCARQNLTSVLYVRGAPAVLWLDWGGAGIDGTTGKGLGASATKGGALRCAPLCMRCCAPRHSKLALHSLNWFCWHARPEHHTIALTISSSLL